MAGLAVVLALGMIPPPLNPEATRQAASALTQLCATHAAREQTAEPSSALPEGDAFERRETVPAWLAPLMVGVDTAGATIVQHSTANDAASAYAVLFADRQCVVAVRALVQTAADRPVLAVIESASARTLPVRPGDPAAARRRFAGDQVNWTFESHTDSIDSVFRISLAVADPAR